MSQQKNFEFIKSDGYYTLKLNGELAAETVKDFEKESEQVLANGAVFYVVNCENLSAMTPTWMRALVQVQKNLKAINKDIRYLFVSANLQKFFKAQGVESVFTTSPSLRAALVEFGLATAKALDVNFINPFLSATMTVLKVQASTEAKPGAPYKKDPSEKYFGDISGVIGLVSEAFVGSVVISFPETTFLKIMSRMLGEEYTAITKEIEDGAGELTNIIFGQAKVALNEKGYGIRTAIPSVVSGKDHSVQSVTRGSRIVIPFETNVGKFVVEICLSE